MGRLNEKYDDPIFHKSRAEVAKELGVSKTMIQKIENRALNKLRKLCEKRGMFPKDWLSE